MMSVGVNVRIASLVPCVTLGQEHIAEDCPAAVAFQPSNRVRGTILTLSWTQISYTLSHTLYVTGPTHPILPSGARQGGQDRISAAQCVRIVPDRRSAFFKDNGLILHPQKRCVIVLHVAPLQLHRSTTRLGAQHADLTHRASDARGAIRHREVALALEESVNHVLWAGADDGVVVVGRVGGRVDQGGEKRVEVGLVR